MLQCVWQHVRWKLVPILFFLTTNCYAQLSGINEVNEDGRKVAFRPFLGRINTYNEVFGLGIGPTLNIEGSPLMTDILTVNLRVGVGTPYPQAPSTSETSFIYSFSTEIGRRRSRLLIAGGLWNVYFRKTRNWYGYMIPARMEFNLFGSVGYRYQAPKGFVFGANIYLIGGESEYVLSVRTRKNYPVFTIWPSVYMGYRIPSWKQHKEFVAFAKLSRPDRKVQRKEEREYFREQLSKRQETDSLSDWRNGEFGVSIFGPGLVTIHHTFYAPLGVKKVSNYYLRSGLGTAMPLLQLHVETGMAFLWNNTGFLAGGGVAVSLFEASIDPFVTIKGKVNLAKGFSGFAGVNMIWSFGEPFTFIGTRGKPYILPTFGVSYRLNRLKN